MAENNFDIVIIGSGPGGYVTAIRAAQLGMRVAVVEANEIGGICLNWGCIPTKALLRSAEVYRNMKHASSYGLSTGTIGFDISAVVKRSRDIADQLSGGVSFLFKKNKITVFKGWGRLAGGNIGARKVDIEKDGKSITSLVAKNVILATGARARELQGLEADGKLVWSYRHALVAPNVPKRLLVIGSGAIGVEFASFFNELGAKVTIVEVMDRVLPVEDEEISIVAKKSFERQGMTILTKTTVKKLDRNRDSVVAHFEANGKTQKQEFDRVISAVGIVGNVENIGLEKTKIKVERTHIVADKWSQTAEAGIYAIGDLTGAPWLAHKASHEGVICVEKIAGVEDVHPLNVGNIPGCTYCHPQVASVGLTEKKAKDQGYDVRVGRFKAIGNGKAIAMGEDEGLVKTIFDKKTGELLGAHMIGAEVTEMIQGYTISRTLETTEAELMNTVFPHPTISEMMHESVLDAYDRVIHL